MSTWVTSSWLSTPGSIDDKAAAARVLLDQAGLRITVYHPDGYVLTAAPMAACLLQMLDGSARRPGLHFQAMLAEPGRLLEDLRKMGVEVTCLQLPADSSQPSTRNVTG